MKTRKLKLLLFRSLWNEYISYILFLRSRFLIMAHQQLLAICIKFSALLAMGQIAAVCAPFFFYPILHNVIEISSQPALKIVLYLILAITCHRRMSFYASYWNSRFLIQKHKFFRTFINYPAQNVGFLVQSCTS